MSGVETVVERISPNGNVQAIVEDDGQTVYFYLRYDTPPPGQKAVRGCWVRNRELAPTSADYAGFERGASPMLPADLCRHPRGAPGLVREALSIVWFEEGNGAALLEGDDVLAVIPPWSGHDGFNGYARDCRSECPLAWPLKSQYSLLENVRKARQYWDLWTDRAFWQKWRDPMLAAYESAFGKHAKYYNVDGGRWPPRALVRFDAEERYVLCTLGMALRPQSISGLDGEAAKIRRVELAAAFDRGCPEAELVQFARFMTGLSARPWANYECLLEGGVVACKDVPPSLGGQWFQDVLLVRQSPPAPTIRLPRFRDEPVNLLWLVPLTRREREFAARAGSQKVVKRLIEAGHGVTHRARQEIST